MLKNRDKLLLYVSLMLALILIQAACVPASQEAQVQTVEDTQVPEPTDTPQPTPTPVPTIVEADPEPTKTIEAPTLELAESPSEEPIDVSLDAETGLPLNPIEFPSGEFIVEGPVHSVATIPKDAPVFQVQVEDRRYVIISQSLDEIQMKDGTLIALYEFATGMIVRATVVPTGEVGHWGDLVLASEDLVVLAKSE